MKEGFAKLGDNLSDQEVAEMFKEADKDGDNFIDFKEFVSFMSQ